VVVAVKNRKISARRNQPPPPSGNLLSAPSATEANDLSWLEGGTTDKRNVIEVDDKGQQWQVLFNGNDLEGWSGKGSWYVTSEEIAGQPWGSSLVSTRVPSNGNYCFQVSGRVITGKDGFIVLFSCYEKFLAWVLGGWGNRRSEVAGYP